MVLYRIGDAKKPLRFAAVRLVVVTILGYICALVLPPRVLAVGDGATDLAIRPVVDAFAAYTGFVRREAVVNDADLVVESFDQLLDIVLA